jgi:hypothetical protein
VAARAAFATTDGPGGGEDGPASLGEARWRQGFDRGGHRRVWYDGARWGKRGQFRRGGHDWDGVARHGGRRGAAPAGTGWRDMAPTLWRGSGGQRAQVGKIGEGENMGEARGERSRQPVFKEGEGKGRGPRGRWPVGH